MSDNERKGAIWRLIAEGYGASEGNQSEHGFAWSDAWVLLALIYCRGLA